MQTTNHSSFLRHPPGSMHAENLFLIRIEKIQYLLNRSSDLRSVCSRLLEKLCLTNRDPWRLYLMNLFFQVLNCNFTVLWVAKTATTQLQHGCSVVSAYCNHLEPSFYPIATSATSYNLVACLVSESCYPLLLNYYLCKQLLHIASQLLLVQSVNTSWKSITTHLQPSYCWLQSVTS